MSNTSERVIDLTKSTAATFLPSTNQGLKHHRLESKGVGGKRKWVVCPDLMRANRSGCPTIWLSCYCDTQKDTFILTLLLPVLCWKYKAAVVLNLQKRKLEVS